MDPRHRPLNPRTPPPAGARDWEVTGNAKMSDAQRRMLNAVCGDLARCIRWHGYPMSKDDFRYLLSGTVLGFRALPSWDMGDGRRGVIMLGRSSQDLTRDQAAEAITMGIHLGDDPASQGLNHPRVDWSEKVLLGMGYRPEDFY